MRSLRIAAIEPYAALSHRCFLEDWQRHSQHRIEILSLPARAWKWRMRTSALHFAELLQSLPTFDLLFVSDYLNLAELLALLPPEKRGVPAWVYFHENQLTYPLQETERRDHHFALIHLYALLTARGAAFNSHFHRRSFFAALKELLRHEPDVDVATAHERARKRAQVLPLGTDAPRGTPRQAGSGPPVILWNHRWEYDKAPEVLLEALRTLSKRGGDFRLRILGQRFRRVPSSLLELRSLLGDRIQEDGFLEDRADYLRSLSEAHVIVSTARHEFFGAGTLEALRAGLLPVLPNDLAYPELLPRELRGRYLYERSDDVADHLERALDGVRSEADADARDALVNYTDRFAWERLSPIYDRRVAAIVP